MGTDIEDRIVLTGATVLKPGSKVLVTTDREVDTDEGEDVIRAMRNAFPDVDFVVVTGFNVFVLDDDEVIVKDRVTKPCCTCGTTDAGHDYTCPMLAMLDAPVSVRGRKFYGANT